MQLQEQLRQYMLLSSREEIDSAIDQIAGSGWANVRYQLGVLVFKRLNLTPDSEKESFYHYLQRKYDISRTTISECVTVARTYSADEWSYYLNSGLVFTVLYLAASKIPDPDKRARILKRAIDEGRTRVNDFRNLLNEIVPSEREAKKEPLAFIRLHGILSGDRNNWVIRSPEGEQSLSDILSSLSSKYIEVSIKYEEDNA